MLRCTTESETASCIVILLIHLYVCMMLFVLDMSFPTNLVDLILTSSVYLLNACVDGLENLMTFRSSEKYFDSFNPTVKSI